MSPQELPDSTDETPNKELGGYSVGFLFNLPPSFAVRSLQLTQAFQGESALNNIKSAAAF